MTEPAQTVFQALVEAAERDLSKTAIRFQDETISYADLLALIETAARHLVACGLGRGSVFAAFSPNRPELMLCHYAAARIGAVFVPLNPSLSPAEVTYAYAHCGAAILFCDDSLTERATSAVPDAAILSLDLLRTDPPGLPTLPRVDLEPGDDFLIIYTSGTTGTPKAIVLDQVSQVAAPKALAKMWGLTAADTTVVALPLGFLYGLSTAAAAGLQSGGTIVILPQFHPRDVLKALITNRASIYHGVPTMFSMMLEYSEQQELTFDLSHLRVVVTAGAPIAPETRQRFRDRFGAELQNYYAMTEVTPVFGRLADDLRPLPEAAVGRAAPGLVVRIVRPDGSDCADNEEGELLVRGAATMRRYLKSPEQTAAAFCEGLFRTGDLGRRDAEGNYYITGRIKEIIIRGGANISPAEVEAALAGHEAVQAVAVVGAPDRIFGEVPVAFVVERAGYQVSVEELQAHATQTLSDFKVPRRYIFETALPLGKTGKVDKSALSERLKAEASTGFRD